MQHGYSLPEGCIGVRRIHIAKVRMIQQIEALRAKLKGEPIADRDVSLDCGIQLRFSSKLLFRETSVLVPDDVRIRIGALLLISF
jgi:hypothetical protein